MTAQKSVVLVTVDCLRADHTGFMGYQRPTTPFLDGLAAESFVFPAAIVGRSAYVLFFAGDYGFALSPRPGTRHCGPRSRGTQSGQFFQQAGYATAFFGAGNPYISSASVTATALILFAIF